MIVTEGLVGEITDAEGKNLFLPLHQLLVKKTCIRK